MGIFRKKGKSNISQNLKSEITLKQFDVDFDGKKIKPKWNNEILKHFTTEISALPKGPFKDCKYMCIHHTNIAVFFAVREGARQQNIPFDYTVTEFYYHINYVDYLNVLTEIQKACGLDHTSAFLN